MNLLRKIIVGLVGLSLAILLTVLLLDPQSIMQIARSLNDTSPLIRLPAAILIDVIVLVVVLLLVRSDRSAARPAGGLNVKAQGAIADVSVDSARDRILRAVRAVPDVLSAETEIKAIHGKADVDLDVVVSRESTNLPEKQKEIDRALRQVVNKQLGLQMAGKPRVHLRMSDETPLVTETAAPAPSPAPLTLAEPVKVEAPPVVPVPIEEPTPPEPVDTMTLRQDETDASEPTTPV